VTYAQLLLLVWVIWELVSNDARVLGLLQSFVLGTYITAIGTLYNALSGHTYRKDEMGGPKGDRYIMSGMQPNDAGLLIAPSVAMALYLLARRKDSSFTTLSCWAQLVLSTTTILLSGSREAVLMVMPAFVILPLIMLRLPRWQRLIAVM